MYKESREKKQIIKNNSDKNKNDNIDKLNISNESDTLSDSSIDLNKLDINDRASLIIDQYKPYSYKLNKIDSDIFDHNPDIKVSTNIDYPKMSLGFNWYLHKLKTSFGQYDAKFDGKKKVYRVMNQFETNIDNFNDSISGKAALYFDTKNKPEILSRAFYKLWEILMMYDLIDINEKNFISSHLAEGPGGFIQATMFFRDMFSNHSKHDKYYAITLHRDDTSNHALPLEDKFLKFYENEKPKRLFIHKTFDKQTAGSSDDKDNGDITHPKTIKLFGGDLKDRPHFITADGGFKWNRELIQEQEAFRLIFAQIATAVKFQRKNGSFVCKMYETFTNTSSKLIAILHSFYDNIFIMKPLTSRISNSEKYIICNKFKYNDNDKEYKNKIYKIDKLIDIIHNNQNINIIDIFSNFYIPSVLHNDIKFSNLNLSKLQYKNINEIITYIDENNFYGDKYQMKRHEQILANTYWINHYFPNKNKFIDAKKFLSNLL